jgi:hypothetical protein
MLHCRSESPLCVIARTWIDCTDLVLVLENLDRFAIRLTEQISSIGLFAVTESQCTEDEHDAEDEDDSKFRNLGLILPTSVLLLE